MNLFEEMRGQIAAISPMPTTKLELMEYFQERYPKNWNQQLSTRLQPYLPLTKAGNLQSIKNIERRHQARGGKGIPAMTKATAAQYAALGKEIGRQPPKNGYSVTYHGEIRISGQCWPKEFGPLLITGDDAAALARTSDIFIIFRVYFQGLDMAEGWCGKPEITIEPAEDGQTQMTFAHGPQGARYAALFNV